MTDTTAPDRPATGPEAARAAFDRRVRVAPVAGLAPDPGGSVSPPPDPPDLADPGDPDRFLRAAALPLNDYGNGQRFVIHFGEDALFVPRVGWFCWTGQLWEKDPDGLRVRSAAQQLSGLILDEIDSLPLSDFDARVLAEKPEVRADRDRLEQVPVADRTEEQKVDLAKIKDRLALIAEVEKRLKDRRSRHRSFANTTGNTQRIKNALVEAEVALARRFDDLDAAPLDVNTESGLLRFSVELDALDASFKPAGAVVDKVAVVRQVPHAREQLVTKAVTASFDPQAVAPRFASFLERIQPDPEVRGFLQRWFGLSMTALTGEQKMVFLYGAGANGKSVLVDLIAKVLGGYAATARIESLTGTSRRGGGEATPDLVPLMGARMVRTSEPDEGQKLQEGLIKELTGGEPILVRALHADFIEVRPVFKLTMSGNHRPDIRGTDDGIWRRVILVPFDVQIPEPERDRHLVAKLMEERAGVLNWLVEGLKDYLVRGLDPPAAILDATQDYREDSDPVGAFLTSCCVVTGEASDSMTARDLYQAFAYWQIEGGGGVWTETTIQKRLKGRAGRFRHPTSGRTFEARKASTMHFDGIKLTDVFRRRFYDAPRDSSGRVIGVAASAPDPDHGDRAGG